MTIGFTLGVVMLWSIGFSSGSVNTARAFGPDVVARSFPSYHWIYCTSLLPMLRNGGRKLMPGRLVAGEIEP